MISWYTTLGGSELSAAIDTSALGRANVDLKYSRRRATEERIAALKSSDFRVRRVHLEMADRYGELIRNAHDKVWAPPRVLQLAERD
jgi:hypothetical protein